MSSLSGFALSATIPLLILAHLLIAPFTKVEESFNIQAIHDVQTFGLPSVTVKAHAITNYDHIEFPGSVPRTFVGAVAVAFLSTPFSGWLRDPVQRQLLARGVIGFINAAALLSFRRSLQQHFGRSVANWYTVFQATQFHVIFYASRTLPNMYAFALTTWAFSNYVTAINKPSTSSLAKRRHFISLVLLTVSGIVFRAEIAVLVFTQTLCLLVTTQAQLVKTIILAGIVGLAVGMSLTVPIDSVLWQHFPTWPEWTSFYYNTIQGQSSNWGVSPMNWYFTNALPRLMMTTLPLIPLSLTISVTRSRSLPLLAPSLSFIALYSLLPHKEWRFVLYTIPPLTATAALSASWIWTRRSKNLIYRVLSLGLVATVAINISFSTASLFISSLNYPGGTAVLRLRDIVAASTIAATGDADKMPFPAALAVHADNLACQTGLTRFLSASAGAAASSRDKLVQSPSSALGPRLEFDKTENATALLDVAFWERFDYALAEKPELCIGAWEVVDVVRSFAGVKIVKPGEMVDEDVDAQYASLPFGQHLVRAEEIGRKVTGGWWVRIRMEPRISILKRQKDIGAHQEVHEV